MPLLLQRYMIGSRIGAGPPAGGDERAVNDMVDGAFRSLDEARPPIGADQDVVVLAETRTGVESDLVDKWVAEQGRGEAGDGDASVFRFSRSPGDWDELTLRRLTELLDRNGDPLLAPVRVVWQPPNGAIRLRDILLTGNPRRPRAALQPWLVSRQPQRAGVVAAEPARVSELRKRWGDRGSGHESEDGFTRFVLRQAVLALERAEAQTLGARYKVPRLVREEIAASPRFRSSLRAMARKTGKDESAVFAHGLACLDEMVAGWSRLLVDLVAQMGRTYYRQGYDAQIEYDEEGGNRLREALAKHPGVILMSHRSNLDALVLPVALQDNDLPRAHGLAGDNMSFWPIGPLTRRAGVIFIRRETKDDPVYRQVLREYVGYLVEKRFNLQWSIEGSRSRTGKMMPPKLGLLTYVVGAYREGRVDDVMLAPVSIAYDQLHEVGEYADYARGAQKRKEGIGWALRFFRAQRGHFGKIYINFAEPVSLRQALGSPDQDAPRDRNELEKLAFEVAWRINQATPITASALVTLILLGADGRALTMRQLQASLHDTLQYIRRRRLPMTSSAQALDTESGLAGTLGALAQHHVVGTLTEGWEPVWRIGTEQQLSASFYRNSLIHFFLDGAIAELAVAKVAREDPADPLATFWQETFALRDLLKFDFFFAGRDDFCSGLESELALHHEDWRTMIERGAEGARELLASFRPLSAHVTLRSFIEAYQLVAHVLAHEEETTDESVLLRRCLGVSRQFLWQGRVSSAESVSNLLLRTGIQLAAHRRLLGAGDEVAARRNQFAHELHDVSERIELIGELGTTRVLQLIETTT